MKINLWYSEHTNEWRWTLIEDDGRAIRMESGNQEKLTNAMDDIMKTVKYLREKKGLSTT